MIIQIEDDLELRQIERSDAKDIFRTIDTQREYLSKWLPFVEFTKTESDSEAFVDSVISAPEDKHEYVFTIRKSNEFVGLVGFKDTDRQNKKTEIGYWLSEEFQKQGIVSKAVKKLCEYAFDELDVNRIQIKCAVGNTPSKNIPKGLGFKLEGVERNGELLTGNLYTDLEVYSKLKDDNRTKEVLLLIDIQNDYFEQGAMTLVNPDIACANAKRLLDRFRLKRLPVIFIQHIANSPAAAFFIPGTEGADIHPSLQPEEGEVVIVKHFPNSFRETELLVYLKANHITDLVICGMMTHMCVDATTRAAKDLGFSITVIGDACATKNLEINGESVGANDVHNSFLSALNYFYSSVKSTSQYLNID